MEVRLQCQGPSPFPLLILPAQPITAFSLEASTEDKVFPVQSLKIPWLVPVLQGHPNYSSASVEWLVGHRVHLPSVSSHRGTGLSGSGVATLNTLVWAQRPLQVRSRAGQPA